MPDTTRSRVSVEGDGKVSVLKTVPDSPPRLLFVYAPGAGSNINDPFGARCAERLSEAGIECWRLQFPYMEAGSRNPDRTPTLEATWRAVIEAARHTGLKVIAGGRSMGGRIASQVVARGAPADLLALFAYPLHPPGKPDQQRTGHLSSIHVPALFCSGTRDNFASPAELAEAAAMVPDATVHLLEGADHGFATLKSSGRTRQEVWDEAIDALLRFVEEH